MNPRALIVAAVHAYLATSAEHVEVDVVADPVVEGTYAVRVRYPNRVAATPQFIVAAPYGVGDLEEVEFTAWPPTSGGRGGSAADLVMSVRSA